MLARLFTLALVGSSALLFGTAASAVGGTGAAQSQGYVRLAHLSPDTPAVDVYLYSGRGSLDPSDQRLVLRSVAYGALSPYQRLGNGTYTVAMRPANAAASSGPVVSGTVRVRGGTSATVAALGPYRGIRLRVLNDSVRLPSGRSALRVIAASLKEPTVDARAAGRSLVSDLRSGTAAPYEIVPAGRSNLRVSGSSGGDARTTVSLRAGSVNTVVVLDGDAGLRLLALRDATQSPRMPSGGVNAGLGGLSAQPDSGDGDRPWWILIGAAGIAVLAGLGVSARRRHG
jgi:hypothetical protein